MTEVKETDQIAAARERHGRQVAMQKARDHLQRAGVSFDYAGNLLFGLPPESHRRPDYWVTQLHAWTANGTFGRLVAAAQAKQPVLVKRSDGSTSVGVIKTTTGFGGRTIEVEIETSEGLRYKSMETSQFLELNPGFGPSLRELES